MDRDIGIVGAVALGVGTMIAAGIFVLSGLAVSNVGAMAIVAFVIAAVVASFTAFAYAEFASIYPESGGGYAYVSNTFDSDLTYIVGWSMILGYPASAAFYLASFSDWFDRFIVPLFSQGLQETLPFWISGLVILGLLVSLNLKGTEESGQFQIAVTALKVSLIVVFLYGGLQAFSATTIQQSVTENLTKYRDIGLTSALVFITFFGFEAIATNAEEIEEPGKNIPRAIFFSMGFVTVVYALVVLVVTLAINNPEYLDLLIDVVGDVSDAAGARSYIAENGELAMGYAASFYLGNVGFYVIIVGALFSMLSAANATVLAGSRVKLAMSRRDHLPDRFENLHPRFNTPYWSVLLTGGMITFFIFFFTVLPGLAFGTTTIETGLVEFHMGIEAIAHFADFMLLTGLIVVNFAIIRSRQKYPDIDRGFTVPAVPYVPVVAIIANLVLIVNVEPGAFALGLAAEGIGVLMWVGLIGSTSEAEIEQQTPTVVEETDTDGREYQILVPIANPNHVEQLMRTARDIAADRGGEVLVLSVVSLPEQTPLSEGRATARERHELLRQAMAVDAGGGDEDVPVHGIVRVGHHVDEAITHTVTQHGSDAVLLGWRGRLQRRRDAVLGTTVDTVVKEADCDVLVERIGPKGAPESILLPTAGGPHAEYAAAVARAIAHTTGATVTTLRVVAPGEGTPVASDRVLDKTARLLDDVQTEQKQVESDDVAEAIIDASGDHDLTIIGATRESVLEQLVFGDIPETVGREADGTVIMAKRALPVTSRVRQLLRRF
ncbi:amino acid permease [Halomicroarcula limicola]|uniref:Amino acid permease n=2 Tax=Haloarcula limicola TaxID=1429915 RepID=A0A8J8C421_9EURY|nr:amino acid permease [Halomicroarcula limicola]MBV0924897.1 amino acid permease [Halomicroarcula limicola]